MSLLGLYLLLGLSAGVLGGMFGIGGGLIIIPALVICFGFSQQDAQGTSLAFMVPPVGILAAWTYYQRGHADLKVAGLLCLGFLAGSLLSARVAVNLSNLLLQRCFGVALLLVGLKMLFAR